MAIIDDGRTAGYFSRHRTERREAAYLFALAYLPCLAAAATRRLTAAGDGRAVNKVRQSIFAEAKRMAASVVPFAFR